jgi:ABC-type nickel/cobalt efflux system permease component RcnA
VIIPGILAWLGGVTGTAVLSFVKPRFQAIHWALLLFTGGLFHCIGFYVVLILLHQPGFSEWFAAMTVVFAVPILPAVIIRLFYRAIKTDLSEFIRRKRDSHLIVYAAIVISACVAALAFLLS